MAKVYPTLYADKCDSDFERAVIDDLIERGVTYGYETSRFDYSTPVTNGYCQACKTSGRMVVQRRYRTLDITLANGIVIEVKGKFPPSIRTYMRHLITCNPEADIRFFFMMDAWQTKGHKKRLSDWARVQGVPCAVGDPRKNPGTIAYGVGGIPQSWIDE